MVVMTTTPATRRTLPPSELSTAEALTRLRAARRQLDAAKLAYDAAIYEAKASRATNDEIQTAGGISLRGSQLAITRHLERQGDNAPAEQEQAE